ncbi:MAG: hypothetical protein JWM11_822 [Planctomycetaceae bacterium]|nr:hypothetical protein [Planctomycetaceae bacterium]
MFRRPLALFVLTITLLSTRGLFAQLAAPPRVGSQSSNGNSALRPNSFEANKPVAMPNKIIIPIPLSGDAQRSALTNLDRHIADQVGDLAEKLKTILPDELSILAKTDGWKKEDQQALVVALRAMDPTAVYEAWAKGNSQDTAGGEIVARQTDVKRTMGRLAQDVEKNKSAVRQNLIDLDIGLGKIANTLPAVADLSTSVKTLKSWVEARFLVESAESEKGSAAKLPTGDITLVFDPTMPVGTAIVLNNKAMLIGNEGVGALTITKGNAAQALRLPIVTGNPLPEAQGEEMVAGTLLTNPKSARGTMNYNLNGNHYVMEPGMTQKLPPDRKWVIEFDRGQTFGAAAYTLSAGTYRFTPTDLGWQLYRDRFDVVLDNSQSNQEFNFIFLGENLTIPAGGSRTLSAIYPIVVRFDRGNGQEFVTKTLPPNGTVQVGVNATDNQWDLFPTTDNRREVSNLKPFNAEGLPKVK